ncbi:MAG: small ribosomal subunit Rsm22 family protein [Candidatus Kryptonium sp.]
MLEIPKFYENFLAKVSNVNLNSLRQLKGIGEIVSAMSEYFTRKNLRKEFVFYDYLSNHEVQKGYLVYFTTTNLLKVHVPLNEISQSGFFKGKKKLEILDIGTGLGTVVMGMIIWMHENIRYFKNAEVKFVALDKVEQNIQKFQEIFEVFINELKNHYHQTIKIQIEPAIFDIEHAFEMFEKRFDLITVANTLNEIAYEKRNKLLRLINAGIKDDGFVILIEPALMITSRDLLDFRNRMVKQGFYIYSPCLRNSNCPALETEKDWCHTEIGWKRPEFIRQIDLVSGNYRKSLKFSYIVASKRDLNLIDFVVGERNFKDYFRVVSQLIIEKGKKHCYLCNEIGRLHCVKLDRVNSPKNEAFDEIERYEIIHLKNFEKTDEEIKITPDTEIEKILNNEGRF